MGASQPGDITRLLQSLSADDPEAHSRLAVLVYDELRRIARARMRAEAPGHTLQPTALVNEAYMALLGQKKKAWQNRSHFYAVAAQMMRRILIDHARAAKAAKRGGSDPAVPLAADLAIHVRDIEEALAVDEALERMEKVDARAARLVELRYFVGLTEQEAAEVLGVSERTMKRDWKWAKEFLRNHIGGTSVS
jgi:RNA polymerase sigma-70 factor, ECF subfamily